MNQPYNRISENALFCTLVAVVVGWMAMSAALNRPVAPSSAHPMVAAAAANRS